MDKKRKKLVLGAVVLLVGAAIWAIGEFDALTELKNFHDRLMSR